MDQLLEPLPLVRVREHVRVEVHAPHPRLSAMDEMDLPDGRRAQLWTGGAASAPAVLVCHGTPDTRWVARTGASAAASAGVRLVCVNRPGYGTSTPHGSTMSSVADDAVAVLDQLGLDRVARARDVRRRGVRRRAGRPPPRPRRRAGRGRRPVGDPDRHWARRRPRSSGPARSSRQWAAGVDVADPDDAALAARWLGGAAPEDAALLGAALTPAEVAASAREALACHDGYLRDAALLFSDWGFDLEDVRCPTHLWYGADDDRNPPANGGGGPTASPGPSSTVTPTTHLATLLANWPTILATLRCRSLLD